MDFLSAILGPVVQSLLVPVKKHLGYLFSSTKHVSKMSTRMKQLDGTSHDVKNHMERNNVSNLEIPARVPDWLKEVEKINEEAERIKEDAERISSNVNGCFNLKMRYREGRKAFKTTLQIEALINENKEITWSNAQKALGKVSSKVASTSGPSDGDGQNDFKSREKIFKEALGLLQQDQKAQVIALCGMGGVGKTTMMEQLKKAVEDKKMFDYVVKVVIGQKVNTFSVQQTVAEDIGCPLTVTDKTARADRLRITFGKISQESKKKVLVILDDVWEMVELKDFGLCPLPNGSKLLLTSRNLDICKQIAVEANSDFKFVRVDVMKELEANNFFSQITGVSKDNDPELNDIGVEIVRRCGFLPLAIKLIARALHSQEKFVWKNTLHRLKENDLAENVQQIIEISYTFLKEDEVRAIFLLCGLFPDDFDIPIEDLTRYAWGLELLKKFPTLGDARNMTKACVRILKDANLLIDSDYSECVKMHDLVLAFVVAKVSKGDHPWIINHGDVSNWSRAEMSESCSRIFVTCMGMSEFPGDFNYPNVSLLRLTNGDESLKFPEDFYKKMKTLQVIAYEKLQYPLLPRSLQCSTKLRTLCLHECSLMFDCSPIGDHLLYLEVLSFAGSGIRYLPSAIGKLGKLKLLDLTDCIDLRIDEGVLKNLVKLEELYMTVDGRSVRFTDINYKELAERSKNLSAFDFEFFENNPQSKNMSYNKLERFSISMGRFLKYGGNVHKSDNRLMLLANKDELLESGLNELFSKTDVLYLEEVCGMNNLEEVLPKSVPLHSFYNLRVLRVTECADLRYLFTVPVASGLMKLERLKVSDCPVMQTLVYGENGEEGVISMNNLEEVIPKSVPRHSPFYNLRVLRVTACADLRYLFTVPVASGLLKLERLTVSKCPVMEALVYSENGEGGVDIRFQELKYLNLEDLPMLVGLSNTNDVIHLPQLVELELDGLPTFTSIYPGEYKSTSITSSGSSPIKPFFNKEAMIPPRLEKLVIWRMEALKNIWAPCGSSQEVDATCLLREIEVVDCDNLVNMFPSNPMPLLHHLETIYVDTCGSIEVLFDIDVGCIGEIKEGSSKLRSIRVYDSWKLREVWRLKRGGVVNINHPSDDLIICGCFQAVEEIEIYRCKRFRNIYTPTTVRFDLGALRSVDIEDDDLEESEEEKKESVERKEEIDDTFKGEIIQVADNMPYVAYPFNLLPTIHHLRSLTLSKLSDVVAVFEIENATSSDLTAWDNQQPPILCHLEDLRLYDLEKMNCVWKCTWNHFLFSQKQRESSFQNLTTINLHSCGKIKYLFSPLMANLLFNLKTIDISKCDGFEEVVSNRDDDIQTMTATTSSRTNPPFFSHLDGLSLSCLSKLKFIHDGATRSNGSKITSNVISNISIHENFKSSEVDVVSWSLCQYPRKIKISECSSLSVVIPFNAVGKLQKLQELKISQCNLLEHVFTSSTLESLKQLKELTIEDCKAMQVIVKEDDLKEDGEHTTSKVIVFPHLKSLTLTDLPNVKGFFLGMSEFQWPHLDKVKIFGCPQMMVFTHGHSKTPKLNYMHTAFGKHSLECGLNFQLTNASNESQFTCSTPDMIKLLQYPWSFSNLVEVDTKLYCHSSENRIFFPHNELHKLQNLEKLNITPPEYSYVQIRAEEVFEVVEETNDYMNEAQCVVVFPKLKEMTLERLGSVKHIWKSNRRIVLNFPNLTKVSINGCPLLGNVLTSCMLGSLSQLQELHISRCPNMEVIVKQVEDSDTRANEVVDFPCLKSVTLSSLENLKGFYLGSEAFIWKSNRRIVLNFPNLTKVSINGCPLLGNVLTSCMLGSLSQLQELHISECRNMEVIVKQVEDSDTRANEVVEFPHLKSVTLSSLKNLKGFYLGSEAFKWQSLDTLKIKYCPQITVFTCGQSTTPELKVIDTSFGLCYATEDPTSFIKTKQQEGWQF